MTEHTPTKYFSPLLEWVWRMWQCARLRGLSAAVFVWYTAATLASSAESDAILQGSGTSQSPNMPAILILQPQAVVRAEGVFLDQLVRGETDLPSPIPHVRIMDAPRVGEAVVLPLLRVLPLLTNVAPEFLLMPGRGPSVVRVMRATRQLHQDELVEALTTELQKDWVRGEGDLQIRLARVWNPVTIADETYELRVSGLPQQGLAPMFQARVELVAGRETLGMWMVSVEAQLFRELWVSKRALKRGDSIGPDDLMRERRDVLRQRDAMGADMDPAQGWECMETLVAGQVLTRRSIQLRPVLERGQVVDALYREGGLSITLKAEVLDQGIPGQVIRVRNPLSKRELRGRVLNSQTVQIQL